MPAKDHSLDQSESPKQDPMERRRLQNRLSQRNHRRKIRDRIAKLQERVIASELRAAATLHGWHSAPCIPYEVKPSPSSTSSSLSLSPASSSPSVELQCPPASYNVGLDTMPQIPMLSTPGEYDETGTTASPLSGSGTSSPIALVPPDSTASGSVLGLAQGYGIDTVQMCEQWGFQGSVYLATETSLPQILQTLGPSSNAIILLPTPGYSVGSGSTVGYTSQGQVDLSGCQCQSLGWMTCPLHPMG